MNVGCILIVAICVSQYFWSAVGLKLSLSNVTCQSSPILKKTTPSSNTPFASKTSNSLDYPESASNFENTLSSPITGFSPKSLSSTPTSSASLFNSDSLNTKVLRRGSSGVDNVYRNNNILSTIRNSLIKQKDNLIPPQSISIQSSTSNDNLSSKIDESSTKTLNKMPLQLNVGDNNNLVLSQHNVETLSTNEVPSLRPSKQYSVQQPNENQEPSLGINHNFKNNSPGQGVMEPKLITKPPIKVFNNQANNLTSSNAGVRRNVINNVAQDSNPFQQNIGPIKSDLSTDTQQTVIDEISTHDSPLNPSFSIPPNPLKSNKQQSIALNQAINSLKQNNLHSLSFNNFPNKISSGAISEPNLSVTKPYKSFVETKQIDIANKIPPSIKNGFISKFHKNTSLQQVNNNGNDNSKNNVLSNFPVNTIQNEVPLQNYLTQKLLASRVTPDTTQNLLPTRPNLRQNHLIGNNNQNLLTNDGFINNENLPTPTLYNKQKFPNNAYLESTSSVPDFSNDVTAIENGVSLFSNTLTNSIAPQLNHFKNIPQLSAPITPYHSEASLPLYTDKSNILQQTTLQLNTYHSNNVKIPFVRQSINPLVEFQTPNVIPETINIYNINSGSYLPTSNEGLMNRFNILETIKPGSFNTPTSIPNLPSSPQLPIVFPQNNNFNYNYPLKNIFEVTEPYYKSNLNPYSPTDLELYDYLYPPIDTSIYKNTVFIKSNSDDGNIHNNSINLTESTETVTESPSTSPYTIPSIFDLPNVISPNGLTLPQALKYNKIAPSNLVVPEIENLLSTPNLTKSIIDLGNVVAKRWIENVWAKKATSAYTPYNPLLPIPKSLPPIFETFVPNPYISPSISPAISPSSIAPPLIAPISPSPPLPSSVTSIFSPIKETEQPSQLIYPTLSTTRIQNDEAQGFFLPPFSLTDLPVYSPSILPTPTINYPVYPPYTPTPPINFPPVPPLFPPMPSIIELPIGKKGSGDSRKLIEILLLASLLNNNDYCNDRGALETLIALMFAT
nr:putative uncharacterized protein DDB_G0287457 [Plodia interpunctella]